VTPISHVIPLLDRKKRHLAWLDFDSSLDEDKLSDIQNCVHVLAPGSIFLVTITSDPINLRNLLDPVDVKKLTEEQAKRK
jgi:hypothetical protein